MALLLLPPEVLIHLMRFLRLPDRQSLAETCRRLYEISLDAEVHKDTSVVFLDDVSKGMNTLANSRFQAQNLVLKELDLQRDSILGWIDFWNNTCTRLNYLSLDNCDVSERTLSAILFKCTKLQTLHLNGCNSLFMSGKFLDSEEELCEVRNSLQNVTELGLAHNRYLTDCLFNRLMRAMPSIKKLFLAGCQISFHPAIYRRFYPQSRGNVASDSVLTFQNILTFIRDQSTHLKSLDLSRTLIDSGSLTELGQVPNLTLTELYLTMCDQLTPAGLNSLCHHQINLRILDLSQCVKVSDAVLSTLCNFLHDLEHVYLRSCRALSSDGFSEMKNLPKLQTVNLGGCEKVASDGIVLALQDGSWSYVTSLNLSACSIDERAVQALAVSLSSLEFLDLSSCRMAVIDSSLQLICKNLLRLRSLQLAWCDRITNWGLGAIEAINESSVLTEATLQLSDPAPIPLSSLRSLVHLDLCACGKITDVGLKACIQFVELQSLNLSLCKHVSDYGITFIGANNPSLERIILSQCHLLTDVGILSMVIGTPRLKHLDVQACRGITDECLPGLAKYCRRLQYLDVSMCLGITQEGLDYFESKIPSIRTIHKRHINPRTSSGE